MLTLISPAKTLDFETPAEAAHATQPALLDRSQLLVNGLKRISARRLSVLMGISRELAVLNKERFASWERPFNEANAKQALFAFNGDVYGGLEAESFSPDEVDYAQEHLRILSGLYGVLRPLDLIQPYRLEMGTRLKIRRRNDLYQFWGDSITDLLNGQLAALETDAVVNLASVEYFKSVNVKKLKANLVSPVFKDLKSGNYKIISFFAKKARGRMAAWIIRNRIEDLDQLKEFDLDGYRYSPDLSDPDMKTLLFTRDEVPVNGQA